jgi:hypothetical protein
MLDPSDTPRCLTTPYLAPATTKAERARAPPPVGVDGLIV